MKKFFKYYFEIFLGFTVLLLIQGTTQIQGNTIMSDSDLFTVFRTTYIDVLQATTNQDYKPLKSFTKILGLASFQSARWEDEVFQQIFHITKYNKHCNLTYHIASKEKMDFDMIRRQCVVQGFIYEIIESAQFIYLRVDIKKFRDRGSSKLDIASNIAKTFFQTNNVNLRFKIIDEDKYPVFSSNQLLNHAAANIWSDRVDGLLLENSIAFIIYKIHPEMETDTDLKEWFDPEDRTYLLKEQNNTK